MHASGVGGGVGWGGARAHTWGVPISPGAQCDTQRALQPPLEFVAPVLPTYRAYPLLALAPYPCPSILTPLWHPLHPISRPYRPHPRPRPRPPNPILPPRCKWPAQPGSGRHCSLSVHCPEGAVGACRRRGGHRHGHRLHRVPAAQCNAVHSGGAQHTYVPGWGVEVPPCLSVSVITPPPLHHLGPRTVHAPVCSPVTVHALA
jgi:hypothetical protein